LHSITQAQIAIRVFRWYGVLQISNTNRSSHHPLASPENAMANLGAKALSGWKQRASVKAPIKAASMQVRNAKWYFGFKSRYPTNILLRTAAALRTTLVPDLQKLHLEEQFAVGLRAEKREAREQRLGFIQHN
jgi:hypothetical protein